MQIIPYSKEIACWLEPLFQRSCPLTPRLWALLAGTIQGRLFVDEFKQPATAFIQDLTEGTVFMGGAVTQLSLNEAFSILRPYQDLVGCLWSDDPILSMLPPAPDYKGVAIDFTDRSPSVDLTQFSIFPSEYTIREIDIEIATKIEGFEYYATMFGSFEKAVQNMIGYSILQGETIACEAEAAPLARGIAEIGIETAEAHRKKGLATAASAYVIQECEKLGYRVFWNAAQQNAGSVALARKLGFRREQPFTVLAWNVAK